MSILHFIRLNETRLRTYQKLMRVFGLVLLGVALYVLLGSMVCMLLLDISPSSPLPMYFGVANNPYIAFNSTAALAFPGLLALAIGDYLGYMLGQSECPRLGLHFLSWVLLAGAAWSVLATLLSLVNLTIEHNARHMGTQPYLGLLVGAIIWATLPQITQAVAQTGLALVVRKLTDLIHEAKATV